jgi:hypothetical protein
VTPALEGEHLHQAPNVGEVRTYWDYPSPPGQSWAERLAVSASRDKTLSVGHFGCAQCRCGDRPDRLDALNRRIPKVLLDDKGVMR